MDWVSKSGIWSSVRAGVGCDADAGEEGVVVVVGVVPGILVWGGGTDWGEGGWLRW